MLLNRTHNCLLFLSILVLVSIYLTTEYLNVIKIMHIYTTIKVNPLKNKKGFFLLTKPYIRRYLKGIHKRSE